MSRVARYVKLTAKPGAERSLAELMLESAELLEQVPGCELYLINRTEQDPAVVWVTEIWRSQEELNGSLQLETVKAHLPKVLPLLDGPPEVTELESLGGLARMNATELPG